MYVGPHHNPHLDSSFNRFCFSLESGEVKNNLVRVRSGVPTLSFPFPFGDTTQDVTMGVLGTTTPVWSVTVPTTCGGVCVCVRVCMCVCPHVCVFAREKILLVSVFWGRTFTRHSVDGTQFYCLKEQMSQTGYFFLSQFRPTSSRFRQLNIPFVKTRRTVLRL